jgi:hypothetical protein
MNDIFVKLNIPTDDKVPEGYNLILAYAKDDHIVVPIDTQNIPENHHDCDWEGCCTLSHVASFSISNKYDIELRLSHQERSYEKLKAFCEALHMENIDKLMTGTITDFKNIGAIMHQRIQELSKAASERA